MAESGQNTVIMFLGNSMGNPGVCQANLYPYLAKPTPAYMGMGFGGYRYRVLWVVVEISGVTDS